MKRITLDESERILAKSDIGQIERENFLEEFTYMARIYPKAGTSNFFWAKKICDWTLRRHDVLFLVTEYGIWPSSENPHLYKLLMKALGDHTGDEVHKLPGHVFSQSEHADFTVVLQIAIDSGWGGYISGLSKYRVGFLSHDRWLDLYGISSIDDVLNDAESLRFNIKVRHQEPNNEP